MWNDYGMMGWSGGWGAFALFHMLLWWVLVILGIVVLVKWLAGGVRTSPGGQALELLKERYARGEIGKEEFEQKKKDLAS